MINEAILYLLNKKWRVGALWKTVRKFSLALRAIPADILKSDDMQSASETFGSKKFAIS